MPKVSVIVPVYNTSEYLKECLASLINQTLEDIEIIAIDDASTDNSLDILKSYAERYPQIKVYHNEKNYGQSITRNLGLDLATGEYIGFIDSDDCIEPTMFETMYNEALENNYPDVITTGIEFVDPGSKIKLDPNFKARWKGRVIDTTKDPMQVYWESPSCCNKLFKKSLIGNYRFLENCTWEDVAFTYSLLMKANSILTFPDKFYKYRRDVKNGVSSKGYNIKSPLNDIFRVSDELEKEAIINGKYEIFKDAILLLQLGVCFQRLPEINSWNIDEKIKNQTMVDFYRKVTEKYGDISNIDDGLLSGKANLILVEKVKEMSEASKSRKTI